MEQIESLLPSDAHRAFAVVDHFLHPTPLLVLISGPSGVGKDSVIQRLRSVGHPFHFVVTATSRPPRAGEIHGQDYFFVSPAEFERMIADDELLEHAVVYGQYKGIPKAQIRQALAGGNDVLLRVDVQGARTVRQLVPQALTIFLAPPSPEVLALRLLKRASEGRAQFQTRLNTALAEMACARDFDYVVVNHEGRLDEAVDQILAIITADKCRTTRQEIVL